MNPVLQTFSDEYRELTLQKECVFRVCFSSFELLPASPYSPAAPLRMVFISFSAELMSAFPAFVNGHVAEAEPFGLGRKAFLPYLFHKLVFTCFLGFVQTS